MIGRMVAAISVLVLSAAHAADTTPLKIAVLNDQSSVYADFQGIGSVIAAQMAVEDYGGKAGGRSRDRHAGPGHSHAPNIESHASRVGNRNT